MINIIKLLLLTLVVSLIVGCGKDLENFKKLMGSDSKKSSNSTSKSSVNNKKSTTNNTVNKDLNNFNEVEVIVQSSVVEDALCTVYKLSNLGIRDNKSIDTKRSDSTGRVKLYIPKGIKGLLDVECVGGKHFDSAVGKMVDRSMQDKLSTLIAVSDIEVPEKKSNNQESKAQPRPVNILTSSAAELTKSYTQPQLNLNDVHKESLKVVAHAFGIEDESLKEAAAPENYQGYPENSKSKARISIESVCQLAKKFKITCGLLGNLISKDLQDAKINGMVGDTPIGQSLHTIDNKPFDYSKVMANGNWKTIFNASVEEWLDKGHIQGFTSEYFMKVNPIPAPENSITLNLGKFNKKKNKFDKDYDSFIDAKSGNYMPEMDPDSVTYDKDAPTIDEICADKSLNFCPKALIEDAGTDIKELINNIKNKITEAKQAKKNKQGNAGAGNAGKGNSDGSSGSNETPIAPGIPTIALKNGQASSGTSTTPTFTVTGVTSGDTVTIFIDNTCSTLSATGTASSNSIDLVVSNKLSVGNHNLYANTKTGEQISSCSSGVAYQVVAPPSAPNAPTIALKSPASSPGTDTTPSFTVSGVTSGDAVKIFSDDSCSTLVIAGITSSSSIDLLISNALSVGAHTFYANTKTGDLTSNCSSGVAYEVSAPQSTPTSITLINPTQPTSSEKYPTLEIGGINNGSNVKIFSDTNCTNIIGTTNKTSNETATITVTIPLTVEQEYFFSSNSTNIATGETSSCYSDDSTAIYTLDLPEINFKLDDTFADDNSDGEGDGIAIHYKPTSGKAFDAPSWALSMKDDDYSYAKDFILKAKDGPQNYDIILSGGYTSKQDYASGNQELLSVPCLWHYANNGSLYTKATGTQFGNNDFCAAYSQNESGGVTTPNANLNNGSGFVTVNYHDTTHADAHFNTWLNQFHTGVSVILDNNNDVYMASSFEKVPNSIDITNANGSIIIKRAPYIWKSPATGNYSNMDVFFTNPTGPEDWKQDEIITDMKVTKDALSKIVKNVYLLINIGPQTSKNYFKIINLETPQNGEKFNENFGSNGEVNFEFNNKSKITNKMTFVPSAETGELYITGYTNGGSNGTQRTMAVWKISTDGTLPNNPSAPWGNENENLKFDFYNYIKDTSLESNRFNNFFNESTLNTEGSDITSDGRGNLFIAGYARIGQDNKEGRIWKMNALTGKIDKDFNNKIGFIPITTPYSNYSPTLKSANYPQSIYFEKSTDRIWLTGQNIINNVKQMAVWCYEVSGAPCNHYSKDGLGYTLSDSAAKNNDYNRTKVFYIEDEDIDIGYKIKIGPQGEVIISGRSGNNMAIWRYITSTDSNNNSDTQPDPAPSPSFTLETNNTDVSLTTSSPHNTYSGSEYTITFLLNDMPGGATTTLTPQLDCPVGQSQIDSSQDYNITPQVPGTYNFSTSIDSPSQCLNLTYIIASGCNPAPTTGQTPIGGCCDITSDCLTNPTGITCEPYNASGNTCQCIPVANGNPAGRCCTQSSDCDSNSTCDTNNNICISTAGGDLSGGDLSGGDLSGGDLSGGDLSGGNLSGGNLSGGDLSGGNLSGGNLTSPTLTGGQLSIGLQ